MIEHVGNASERKFRLFSVACCRRTWDVFADPRSRRAVEVAERAVEGLVSESEIMQADTAAYAAYAGEYPEGAAAVILSFGRWQTAAYAAAGTLSWQTAAQILGALGCARANRDVGPISVWGTDTEKWNQARAAEAQAQGALIREIFGNPFEPVSFSPQWRTDTAVSLARQIYEACDFSAMPILADALQDAGCDSEDVLSHCRDPKQGHVRGCWVLDLVLDKA
jgi:hypothetical protein